MCSLSKQPYNTHSHAIVSRDKAGCFFFLFLQFFLFSFLNWEPSPYFSRLLQHIRLVVALPEQLWVVLGMFWASAPCQPGSFREQQTGWVYTSASWQMDFQIAFTESFPLHIKKHVLCPSFVCWHFTVDILIYFPLHLVGKDGNWGALFKQNMLSLFSPSSLSFSLSRSPPPPVKGDCTESI